MALRHNLGHRTFVSSEYVEGSATYVAVPMIMGPPLPVHLPPHDQLPVRTPCTMSWLFLRDSKVIDCGRLFRFAWFGPSERTPSGFCWHAWNIVTPHETPIVTPMSASGSRSRPSGRSAAHGRSALDSDVDSD